MRGDQEHERGGPRSPEAARIYCVGHEEAPHDPRRLSLSEAGVPTCPECGREFRAQRGVSGAVWPKPG